MLKKNIFPLAVIILSIAGILLAFTLAEEFHYLNLPQSDGSSPAFFSKISSQVCGDANSFFSCDNVSKSKYARLFGFPTALYGVFFYLVALFLACGFSFAPNPIRTALVSILFWLAAFGVIIDMVLLFISLAHIDALCPLCLFTYAINLLLLGITITYLVKVKINPFKPIAPFRSIDIPSRKPLMAATAMIASLSVFAAIGISYDTNHFLVTRKITYIHKHKADEINSIIAHYSKQKVEDIHPTALKVYGAPEAPVTIVEFSDFLCPYCGFTSRIMDALIEQNPKKIKLLFVNFPLDISCNRFMRRPMHKGSCELAKGAICAAQQNRLGQYQKAAFSLRQKNPGKYNQKTVASLSGLSMPEFEQCLDSPETVETLERQIEQGEEYGVAGTPTIYINNKRYKGRLYIEALQKIIDMEVESLKAEGKSVPSP